MMKITIEGWEEAPVVLEDVNQFIVVTINDDESLSSAANADSVFLGYAIAHLQNIFKKEETNYD